MEVQKELLTLLKEFDAVCQKEQIRYSISSGTLLGAVRHRGFIPWDDDLDVSMLRRDFEHLKRCIAAYPHLKLGKYLWLDRIQLTASVMAKENNVPAMDVFIWDNIPDNAFSAKMKYFAIAFLQGMLKESPNYRRFSFAEKVFSFVSSVTGRLFKKSTILCWYEKVAQWGNGKATRHLGGWHDQFHALRFVYAPDLMDGIERRTFEDTTVCSFADADGYLRMIYGNDYMCPPEKSKRKPHNLSYHVAAEP